MTDKWIPYSVKSRTNPDLDVRNAAIVKRHLAGESFASIARDYGISGTRVSQVFHIRVAWEAENQ